MKENYYFELSLLIERLHRHLLEIIKLELDELGSHDINSVQAMMLFNIGDAEMTIGELTLRDCYLGSNVSYNVKKMAENGYLVHERSVHDRRSIRVRAKGRRRSRAWTAVTQYWPAGNGCRWTSSPGWISAHPLPTPSATLSLRTFRAPSVCWGIRGNQNRGRGPIPASAADCRSRSTNTERRGRVHRRIF